MKFGVFSSDPLFKYYQKGEVKPRYWNPENLFAEVCVFTFCDQDIEPGKVQALAGGARLRIVPLGPPGLWRLPGQRRRAAAVLGEFRPDLVRVHNPWHAGLVGVGAARRLGIPVLLSLHTHYGARRRWEGGWRLQALRVLERYSISRADCALCVTHYLEEYARGAGARQVEVIYNRVYGDQFACERSGFSNPPVILSVGRLDPPKDQACLIRALCGVEAELVLVGEGVNRRALEQLARDQGVAGRVHFAGAVPHGQIQGYYRRADIFAMASHYEGFCIPLLEAMAAGLPVVAGRTDPFPEILGGQGVVVGHDPGSFRAAFLRLMADPRGALELGARARARAQSLDGALMEKREAALYRALAARGSCGQGRSHSAP
jgi:glycosyltransferase involved in cell wall biosynthesis